MKIQIFKIPFVYFSGIALHLSTSASILFLTSVPSLSTLCFLFALLQLSAILEQVFAFSDLPNQALQFSL